MECHSHVVRYGMENFYCRAPASKGVSELLVRRVDVLLHPQRCCVHQPVPALHLYGLSGYPRQHQDTRNDTDAGRQLDHDGCARLGQQRGC